MLRNCCAAFKAKITIVRVRLSVLLLLFPISFLLSPWLEANQYTSTDDLLPALNETWTGDFDAMVKRRRIRALVIHNKMMYFLDQGRQRGASYELLKQFEEFINEPNKSEALKIELIFIPVNRDEILPALTAGKGDIAAANLTVTSERMQQVDFSDPLISEVRELVVTGPSGPNVSDLDSLAGQQVHVRMSSSYYESLISLNDAFEARGLPPVRIKAADEYLEDSDLLEMVNAGLIPMVIVDSHKAQFWSEIFSNITVHEEVAVNTGGQIAWATRKDSPVLAQTINEFVNSHKKGTLLGNILYKRYLKENKWVRNALSEGDLQKFEDTLALFKKHANRYEFDWLMVAAQAYQESGLDHSKRSPSGAVGIMQVLPSTAADPNVDIPNIEQLEANIHAGTKYLRFLQDRYFSAQELETADRYLFAFAAYNAGPARVAKLRKEAPAMGLSPDRWFGDVEVVAAKRIGRETVQYVSNIYKYYLAYRLLMERARLK